MGYRYDSQYSHMRDDHGLSALFDVAQKVVERKFKEMAFFVKWFLLFSSASYFPISGEGLLFYPYISFNFFPWKLPFMLCVTMWVCVASYKLTISTIVEDLDPLKWPICHLVDDKWKSFGMCAMMQRVQVKVIWF